MTVPSFVLLNSLTPDFKTLTGRYVAFPVGKSKSGKYLLATCAHTIADGSKFHHFQFLYADGSQLPSGEPSKNYIMPMQLGLDLAIIEIELDRELSLPRIKEGRIPHGAEMSHVRNVYGREEFDGLYHVTTSVASEIGKYFRLHYDTYVEIGELRAFSGQIPARTHRGLSMQSFPGVSGSPLWDKFGNVRGMVAGGNETLTTRYPEYFLCFLPIDDIIKALKKFLGNQLA